jgi:hypothetical protein
MNNNHFNNNVFIFTELQVFKECSYFYISFKDSFECRTTVSLVFTQFSIDKAHFLVLKSCRILCKHTDNNNNNTSPIKEYKIDPINKMMSDTTTTINGTQMPGSTNQAVLSHLPSTLQENNNESTLRATAEDDDNATVQTSNSNTTKQAWKS